VGVVQQKMAPPLVNLTLNARQAVLLRGFADKSTSTGSTGMPVMSANALATLKQNDISNGYFFNWEILAAS
jgi:hypothetical protein